MLMNRHALLIVVILTLSLSMPLTAWQYTWNCRNEETVFGNSTVTFEPTLGSFPAGSAWRTSIESARNAWNNETPSSVYQMNFNFVNGDAHTVGDGRNTILITDDHDWDCELGVTIKRRNKNCPIWPFSRPRIIEADILFNPDIDDPACNFGLLDWENATNPPLPLNLLDINSTLVALHEMGHAFGLAHENGVMGTLDEFYPDGGPIGNGNQVHPHADDVGGNLDGYGWTPLFGPWERDVAASAFRRDGAGTSEQIPAPVNLDRGVSRAMQFTLENRSLHEQNSVRVEFFLSTNDFISTFDTRIGATTLNLPGLFTGTLTANVTVPTTVTPGNYWFGYIVDVNGQIVEINEGNNAVAYANPSTVTTNNIPPSACFTVTPSVGLVPLMVTVNASCSSDPDGTIVDYSWDMGDGGLRSGQSFTYFYNNHGYYQIRLTVRDNDGATDVETDFVEAIGDCSVNFC